MSEDWLLERLADLRCYAQEHDLVALAAHLDQAIALAHVEIASTRSQVAALRCDDSPG